MRESSESAGRRAWFGCPHVPANKWSSHMRGDGGQSRLGLYLATVGNRLVEIWRQVMEEGLADPGYRRRGGRLVGRRTLGRGGSPADNLRDGRPGPSAGSA